MMRDKMEDEERGSGSQKPEVHGSSIVVKQGEILLPDTAKAQQWALAWKKLKSDLLVEGQDKVLIQGKMAVTRSGAHALLVAFGGSSGVVDTKRVVTDKDYIVHAYAEAWLPNGRRCRANSSCARSEWKADEPVPEIFVIEGTAGTRAEIRAIINLLGGGILSAEEDWTKSQKPGDKPTNPQASPAKPVYDPTAPATENQKGFLVKLSKRAWGHTVGEAQLFNYIHDFAEQRKWDHKIMGELTGAEAHDIIEVLKALPEHEKPS